MKRTNTFCYSSCILVLFLVMTVTSSTYISKMQAKCNNTAFVEDDVSDCNFECNCEVSNSCREYNIAVMENAHESCTIDMHKESEISDRAHEHLLSFEENKHKSAVFDNMSRVSSMTNRSYFRNISENEKSVYYVTINERFDNKTESLNSAVKEASTSERLRLLGAYSLSLVIIWVILIIFIKRGARNAHRACYATQDVVVVDVVN